MDSSDVLWQAPSSRNYAPGPVVVGLVNNMTDAALLGTEGQFRDLLPDTCAGLSVSLRLFAMPETSHEDANSARLRRCYEDISELWTSRLDGLIVTGREPRTSTIPEEAFWPNLTRLADWAEDNTISTIWSCLAAQAAVLHLHGISRRKLGSKLHGIFRCDKVANHPLVAGAPAYWRVPHSRYNEIPEDALRAHGYQVLSRSREAGADMFVSRDRSLFVFFQGHPEYGPGSLLGEYRRDIGRFLAGERDSYPEMPSGCFDAAAAMAFSEFRQQALRNRDIGLLLNFPSPATRGRLPHLWREYATRVYANWVSYLGAEKTARLSLEKATRLRESA